MASLPIRRLCFGVDRQDYLSAQGQAQHPVVSHHNGNNEQSYCFGMHLNFAPSLDSKVVQAEAETSGDLGMLYPHRRFVRLWLNAGILVIFNID